MDLFSTPTTGLIESRTKVTGIISVIGNIVIFSDHTCTVGHVILLSISPNPISKVCFGASCFFGVAAFVETLLFDLINSFRARVFNRLGKYTLDIGNITMSNITNINEIANLMS